MVSCQTQLFWGINSTRWKTVESLCSVRTTTWSLTQVPHRRGAVEGHQSQRPLCHQAPSSPLQGQEVVPQRTLMPLQSPQSLRPPLEVAGQGEGQRRFLAHQRRPQRRPLSRAEGPGVGLLRWSLSWQKWALRYRIVSLFGWQM